MASWDDELAAIVAQANGDNEENTLDPSAVRTFIAEFYAEVDEENESFPDEADEPHWDLLAADFASEEPLAVAFILLTPDRALVMGGQGDGTAHFDFGEDDDFPEDDADGIEATARSVFRMGAVEIRADRADVRAWAEGD